MKTVRCGLRRGTSGPLPWGAVTDPQQWIERDRAVVWHGFTQMATFADNNPVLVERAEGRELIGVDGRRYLDAISSLWVTTLGHRVPELDAAAVEQLGKVAHSTLLGNGNTTTVEFAEALARVVPVDGPHFLFASDGAAAVEQAIKIAFQFWTNQGVQGRTKYLAFGGAYHGDTIGSLSIGAGGFGTDVFDPLRFPVLRAPGFDDPGCIERACELIAAHHHELAAVVVEPLVQGAAGMQLRPAEEFAALGEACRRHDVLLICDEVATGFGRTGTMFAVEQCGLRPDLMTIGKGITGGYLALAATVANDRVYEAFLGEDLSDAHALPRPLLQREHAGRRGRTGPPGALHPFGCARQRDRTGRSARRAAERPDRSARPGRRRSDSRASWSASSSRHHPVRCAGAVGCAPAPSTAGCCCARSATSWCSCRS